ncbi:MAG: hybrid sensor histidine kinase/response regulator [Gallionella sp.]|nr:hybrid sensor histidine kinase/response regulator [Gallionella sp.]
MAKQNDAFLKKLLATFRVEADEHLKAMSAGLVKLEKNPAAGRYAEIVESVFREAHSLKGAARAVNIKEIESVCQPLESVLAALKGNQLTVSPPLFDLLYQTVDALGGLLVGDAGTPEPRQVRLEPLIRRLGNAVHGQFAQSGMARPVTLAQHTPTAQLPDAQVETAAPAEAAAPVAAPSPVTSLTSETVRVSTQKLDAVMRQVEELLSPRLASAQRAKELREVTVSFVTWKKQRARIRPTLRLIERYAEKADNGAAGGLHKFQAPEFPAKALPKLLEHLEAEQLFMKALEERLLRLSKFAAHDRHTLAGMSDSLLHDVKEMHLLPFASLLESFPRFIRELARDEGKQVELTVQGSEIEIDRRILEEMKAPLIHLLRNCIDHGIEQPSVRQDRGKPPHGTITVAIAQKDGGKIEILVADDGAGIDAAKVKAAACRLGAVSAEEADKLSAQEAQALIFQSGISTSQIITDVSGRGLGLAIVREKVERLGGTVSLESGALESRDGGGTSFRIVLPLMLATFRGVLVRVGEHCFVIPALSIERAARVNQQDILTVENRATIPLDGQAVALTVLGDVLELPRRKLPHQDKTGKNQEKTPVVVLGVGHQRVAFQVDEILGEQEVLVKTLGRQLARVRNIAGASVLGTGQVVAVLNVPDLLKSAVRQAAPPPAAAETPAGTHEAAEKQAILVVEDSITSRALLKNILESAGYLVTTAVDGMDAYTTLKTGTFDLIVSDVEMPRMNGFDLTAKVRADKRLGELPVVLVTALESREHRERGIDVGANAYIVKSSFDQSNLLEVIRRLI